MADIALAGSDQQGNFYQAKWETLTSSDAAGASWQPINTQAAIAAVTFTGTFDSATAVLQGSNDGTNWVTLNDISGSPISLTAAGYAEFSTALRYLRPSTSGGGGSQDVDCIIVARG